MYTNRSHITHCALTLCIAVHILSSYVGNTFYICSILFDTKAGHYDIITGNQEHNTGNQTVY